MSDRDAACKLERVMKYMSQQIKETVTTYPEFADAVWNAGFIVGGARNEILNYERSMFKPQRTINR